MKRYGKEATIAILKDGGVIRFNDYFTLDGGYRLYNKDGEKLGYITCDLFSALWRMGEGSIVKIASGYSWSEYAMPVKIEINDDADSASEAESNIGANDNDVKSAFIDGFGVCFSDFLPPAVFIYDRDDDDGEPEAPTMQTPDSIRGDYSISYIDDDIAKPRRVSVLNGDDLIMICELISYDEMREHQCGNECFELCEIFSANGAKWLYWRDNESNEDFITLIGKYKY